MGPMSAFSPNPGARADMMVMVSMEMTP